MLAVSCAALAIAGTVRALVGDGHVAWCKRAWAFPIAGLVATAIGPSRDQWFVYLDHWQEPLAWPLAAWLPAFYVVVPWLTLTIDIDDWKRREVTSFQWSAGPFALAALQSLLAGHYIVGPFLWASACWFVGMTYQDLLEALEPRVSGRRVAGVGLDANRYAEALLGATVQGAVALLRT